MKREVSLTHRQVEILQVLAEYPQALTREIVARTGLGPTTIEAELKALYAIFEIVNFAPSKKRAMLTALAVCIFSSS